MGTAAGARAPGAQANARARPVPRPVARAAHMARAQQSGRTRAGDAPGQGRARGAQVKLSARPAAQAPAHGAQAACARWSQEKRAHAQEVCARRAAPVCAAPRQCAARAAPRSGAREGRARRPGQGRARPPCLAVCATSRPGARARSPGRVRARAQAVCARRSAPVRAAPVPCAHHTAGSGYLSTFLIFFRAKPLFSNFK